MKKIDAEVLAAFTQAKGSPPSAYIYTMKRPHFLSIILSGGLFFWLLVKPLMMGAYADGYYFIRTSFWTTSKLIPEKNFFLSKSDIEKTTVWKFGPARYFTIFMKDGSKMKFVANSLYRKLEKQGENIDTILTSLGTKT